MLVFNLSVPDIQLCVAALTSSVEIWGEQVKEPGLTVIGAGDVEVRQVRGIVRPPRALRTQGRRIARRWRASAPHSV